MAVAVFATENSYFHNSIKLFAKKLANYFGSLEKVCNFAPILKSFTNFLKPFIMDIKQIFEKYLEPLQNLQANVANSGNESLRMQVLVSPNDNIYADLSIFNGDKLEKHIYKFFGEWLPEEWMDNNLIELNAFFAECCTTTACAISLN